MPGFGYGRQGAVKRAVGQRPAPMRPTLPAQASDNAREAQLAVAAKQQAPATPALPQALPAQASPVAPPPFGMRPQLNQGVPLTGDAIRMQEQQRALNGRMQARGQAMDELFNRRMV